MIPVEIRYLLFGVLLAVITTELEYVWWSRKKNEKLFHALGFASVALVSVLLLTINPTINNAISITLGFWNIFELYGNYRHGQDLLYIGNTARIDRFLRKIDEYVNIKLLLHIFSLILFIFLLLPL
jgi:purine-cytosine permease-like protein